MPKLRRDAVRLMCLGWSARKVGRYLGFHHTAVMKWKKYAKKFGDHPIPTKSSKPKHYPKELSETLIKKIVEKRLAHHRYTRIGKPNDNAHIERFNRTVQEECLDKISTNVKAINCALKKCLKYYNNERLHFGINFLTPIQMVPSY